MKSQANRILDLLESKEWTCVTEMMALYIPDYRRRLVDLKKSGHPLEGKPCTIHNHESKNMKMWKLSNPRPYKIRELKLSDGTVVSREKIFI